MKNQKSACLLQRILPLLLTAGLIAAFLSGCETGAKVKKVKLDPKNPVIVSVWHYYNGPLMNAFESMLIEFNETVGAKEGIIIEGYGMGNVAELERVVLASANKEIGSFDMPNIFASYADTAYAAEKMDLLADLDDYFSREEQQEYLDSYIEEGKIGLNGELRIFPIAKSTEIMMLNETDWLPFAEANSLSYDDLATMEDLARVAELYYNWTDLQTPEILNDGKPFFGRDSIANLFIIGSKEFDIDIFKVENGTAAICLDPEVMRKIWDYYYVPYISGYYSAYGKFRSEDLKVGDILCYVGSTASAMYFPNEVTIDGRVYPIEAAILPVPHFKDAKRVMVQQGAGMVVTKATPQEEYASTVFLKWFTQAQKNIKFAAFSGYMPVKKAAAEYDMFVQTLEQSGLNLDESTNKTLKIALQEIKTSELYTNKAFDGGTVARAILENDLQDKAKADRESVLWIMANGSTHEDAVAHFSSEESFNKWLEELTVKLNEAVK